MGQGQTGSVTRVQGRPKAATKADIQAYLAKTPIVLGNRPRLIIIERGRVTEDRAVVAGVRREGA